MDYSYLANIVHVAASGNSLEEVNPWESAKYNRFSNTNNGKATNFESYRGYRK